MKKFSEYTNVPMWQLFASPEEVRNDDKDIIECPKCHNRFKLIDKGE